jgi:4-diphosphocytidyl-2-C-methyl-D-erythritol kinase
MNTAAQCDWQWNWDSAWPAPAKLNLFLHVVGRRTDGYHLLQTVFRFIDRADTLHFSPRADGEIRLLTPLPGVPAEQDLTVRAARLLQQAGNCRQGADIRLDKRLPMGGGLGGGSSDAATVLLALNHLWQLHLPRQRLQEIGLTLGADVPVFIYGQAAFAEGVGEALRPIAAPPAWYLVIEPGVAVPTAAIFGAPELKRDSPATQAAAWQPDFGGNDLEAVACQRFPAVAAALALLAPLAEGQAPRMSGSGACVFATYSSQAAAEAALARLPADTVAWVASGLDRHPLYALADEKK